MPRRETHLLEEHSFERQAPLNQAADDERSSGSDSNYGADIPDVGQPTAGDLVRILGPNGVASEFCALVVSEKQVRNPGVEPKYDDDVLVWLSIPSFCGAPESLFRYVREVDLVVVERLLDRGDLVYAFGGDKTGTGDLSAGDLDAPPEGCLITTSEVNVAAVRLDNLIRFHNRERHSVRQKSVCDKLRNPGSDRKTSVAHEAWYRPLDKWVQRSRATVPRIDAEASRFIRGQPFFLTQVIVSKKRVMQIPLAPTQQTSDTADTAGIRPSGRRSNSLEHHDSSGQAQDTSNNDDNIEPDYDRFIGHVTSVSFAALVELILPTRSRHQDRSDTAHSADPEDDEENGVGGSSGSGTSVSPYAFVVLVPSRVVDRSTQSDHGHDGVMFRNLADYVEESGERIGSSGYTSPSVAHPYVDRVSALMYAEFIPLDVLRNEVVWLRGTYPEYLEELRRRVNVSSRGRRVSPAEDLCGNGIVLFAFPESITAVDMYDDGLVMQFSPEEVIPVETNGHDAAVVGRHGFLLDENDPLFDVEVAAGPSETSSDKADGATCERHSATVPRLPSPSERLLAWYVAHGILPSAPEEPWSDRMARFLVALDKLVVIESTSSVALVRNIESGNVIVCPTKELVHISDASIDAYDGSLFAGDVVVPSMVYRQQSGSYGATASEQRQPLRAVCLCKEDTCSIYDTIALDERGAELVLLEPVRCTPGALSSEDDGDPWVEDPPCIGIVQSVNFEDKICVVSWFAQPLLTPQYFEDRRDCVGQVIALLPNTLVRVMWSDGVIEDIPRAAVIPCRTMEEDEYDEEEEDEEEVGEEESEHTGHGQHRGSESEAAEGGSRIAGMAAAVGQSLVNAGIRAVMPAIRSVLSSLMQQQQHTAETSSDDEPADSVDHVTSPQQHHSSDTLQSLSPPSGASSDIPPATTATAEALPRASFTVVPLFTQHLLKDACDEPLRNPLIFHKRMEREWRNLRTAVASSAPECPIYVKACSEDKRLLKFGLVGPLHTPYYGSFLAFDVACGAEFPFAPPLVSFHAYRLRLNPNLYEDGHICLSLLGTWNGGDACESWNPASSSLMQVMLSIQSLVLVKEPYYNEAGFDEQRGTVAGRAASKEYTEALALLRIEHTLAMASAPPADWVFDFRRHFLATTPLLIRRMTDLLDRSERHDPLLEDGAITADGLVLPITRGFAVAMRRAIAVLSVALDRHKREWEREEAAMDLRD